jgi:hypothetical protein
LPKPVWPNWPTGPTGLLAHPAHSARLSQPAWVWVGQPTQPSPHSFSSLPLDPAGDLDHRHRRLATPANSGDLRHRCFDRMVASTSSTNSSSWDLWKLPLRGDLDGVPSWNPPPPIASSLVLRQASSPMLAVQPLVLELHEISPVEAPWCGAPGECSVKSTLGSLWPATQALPCYAIQMST